MTKKVTSLKEVKENQIKITKGELRNLILLSQPGMPNSYQKLINPVNPEKMSGKVKVKMMRLSMRLNPVLQQIEKEREGIVKIFAVKDEKGNPKTKLNPTLISKYAKKDAGNRIMIDGKGDPILDLPKDLPQEAMVYDMGDKEKEFNEELSKLLKEAAEISGERITIDAEDVPDNMLPYELEFLSKLINFKE